MKTLVLLCALSSVALAGSRSIVLTPVANIGQTLDPFCREKADSSTVSTCPRNNADDQCHDAKRWDPLGTGVVKEARVIEVHGASSLCVPAVRTTNGWAPFVGGGMAIGRKNDARVDRIDIVEPKNAPSYALFRFAETQVHGITTPMDHHALSFAVCRIDEHGVACGTHPIEAGLDVKMREDGRVELSAHRDPVAPGAPTSSVSPAAQAQIGLYDLAL